MRRFFIGIVMWVLSGFGFASLALAGTPYVGLSFGTSFETHAFDVWNGAGSTGRRALGGKSASSDQAIAIGLRDAFAVQGQSFDIEFELFERRNARFDAKGARGPYPTRIKTNSILASLWTPLYRTQDRNQDWALAIGLGVGARQSRYQMSGNGLNIQATDRAPIAMLGLRLTRRISTRVSLFGEWRVHTRPPVKLSTAGRAFAGPLEHNSKGQTLRFGVQINLGR